MVEPIAPKRLLIIGCGDLGCDLGAVMAKEGWQVWGLRRDPRLLPAPINGVGADVVSGAGLEQIASLRPTVVAITLTPGETTDAGYRRTYIEGSVNVRAALAAATSSVLFVSSTSVYHQNEGEWVDEHSPTEPATFSGKRLLEAEGFWRASGSERDARTCIVRLGGIYGPGRDRLLRQLRAGRRHPEQPVRYSNRIHRDDAVGLLAHLVRRLGSRAPLQSCYCGVDSEPTQLVEVERWLAERMGLNWAGMGPSSPARSGNRRVCNAASLAIGYRYQYPSFREGFGSLLAQGAS